MTLFNFYHQSVDYGKKTQILSNELAHDCSVLHRQCYANFLFQNPKIFERLESKKKFRLSWKFCIRICIKVFIHSLFRSFYLFNQAKIANRKSLIKAWVDINISEWEESVEILDCGVLVLPFPISIRRQGRFIKFLRRNKLNYTLYGYKYSLRNLLRFCIQRTPKSLVELEIGAQVYYVSDVVSVSPTKLYVMDDVEFYSHYANSKLIERGFDILFSAHGIGRYSLHYNCTNYTFFNDAQHGFFDEFNFLRNFKIKFKSSGIYDRASILDFTSVCFISQLSKTQTREYYGIEKRILEIIKKVCPDDVELIFKRHPNSRNLECPEGYLEVERLDEYKRTVLFLTLYSTAYYSFQDYGQTILIETKELDSKNIFGDNERIVREEELDTLFSTNEEVTTKSF